jgi:uncharacterized protein YndB with AHSA1/START domain
MKEIIHAVDIDAAPSAVYEALTTESGVTGWWTTNRRVEWRCVGGHATTTTPGSLAISSRRCYNALHIRKAVTGT